MYSVYFIDTEKRDESHVEDLAKRVSRAHHARRISPGVCNFLSYRYGTALNRTVGKNYLIHASCGKTLSVTLTTAKCDKPESRMGSHIKPPLKISNHGEYQ